MNSLRAKNPITCAKCGVVDQTRKDDAGNLIVGTDAKMRCPDCGDPYAKLCRLCCPSQHCTSFEAPVANRVDWQACGNGEYRLTAIGWWARLRLIHNGEDWQAELLAGNADRATAEAEMLRIAKEEL